MFLALFVGWHMEILAEVFYHEQYNIRRQQDPALMADSVLLDVTFTPFRQPYAFHYMVYCIMGQLHNTTILQYWFYKFRLLMEYPEEDQSLQDSLDQLDQDIEDQNQSESLSSDSDQDGEGDVDEKELKGNRAKKEEEEEEKKDYYAQFLAPDEQVDTNPPFVVVVQGSKSSGKTSIIRSLVRHYTKHKVDEIAGTITLRSNKKQRITIIECPNDITAMIDLSKIADIVLLVIDGSLTFEMQTFEFLSLLKCHGFPNVMGVLTHLDFFKENKQLRKTKKKFKKRFEYEVGGKSKLFFLDKWDKGVYPTIQIAKMARYIGNSKPPTIPWRTNHPFILADRWQTVQDRGYKADDQIDVSFYGYVRGSSYRVNGKVHVVGMGDFQIKDIEVLHDPCPEFKKEGEEETQPQTKGDVMGEDQDGEGEGEVQKDIGAEITKKRKKKRTLGTNERIIYAPGCNLGTLNFDYSSGYVTIPHDYVKFTRIQDVNQGDVQEGVRLMRGLQDLQHSMNKRLKEQEEDFQLIEGMKIQDMKEEEEQGDQKIFRKKQAQIRNLKRETDAREIVNPHEQHYERRTDLTHLIYESKESIRMPDNCKFQPQGNYSENLKDLFVTGMEDDVLGENPDESDDEERKKQQIKKIMNETVVKATISEQTNFYKKGLYVRVVLEKIKYGTFTKMKQTAPVILARNNLGEENKSFLKVRFKRHRWYSNLLKSNDPIIVSSGWRRYQSLIIFSTEDQNDRMRYLKYTPQHDFCYGVYYGNFCIQNTGAIFLQTIRNDLKKFRIAGSGIILEMNKAFEILKKIKLIGEPYKIMKHTAFVKGMFNSSIEVSSYVGAQIRTVSGIRGQIKKAIKEGGQGTFRATFEDKINLSDLIFCKAWYKVILDRFYNPILSFQPQKLMKTKYELRMETGTQVVKNPDSEYKTIDRAPKVYAPFTVPKKLQAKLPFKTVQKIKISKKEQIRRAESQSIPKLLQGDKERQVAALIQRLNTIKNMKEQKKEQKFKEKERIREARERPKAEYYDQLKKKQKSEKMASLMRKKKQGERRQERQERRQDD